MLLALLYRFLPINLFRKFIPGLFLIKIYLISYNLNGKINKDYLFLWIRFKLKYWHIL